MDSSSVIDPKPLRLALIGAGTFARTAHFSALSELQKKNLVNVRLVWSRSAKSAIELARRYGPHVVAECAEHSPVDQSSDVEGNRIVTKPDLEMSSDASLSAQTILEKYRSEIDAAIIAVPIPQNAAFTKIALRQGLHVFCEKPIAHDISTAMSLLADPPFPPSSAIHAVGENFRFECAFKHASKLASQCGRIIALHLNAQTPMPQGSRYAYGWRLNLQNMGILVDGFVHHVAGLRVLAASDVSQVYAHCSSNADHFSGADTASAILTFENGLRASVFVTYACSNFSWKLSVVGTNGDVTIARCPGKPGYRVIHHGPDDMQSDEHIPFTGIENEFAAFVESCCSKTVHPDLDARVAVNDLATVQCMFQSSEENRPINVPSLHMSYPTTAHSS